MSREDNYMFDAFREACLAIHAHTDPQPILTVAVELVTRLMKAKGTAIRILDRDTGKLTLSASFGLSQSYLDKGPVLADESLADVPGGEPVVIADVEKSDRVQYPKNALAEGIRSIIGVPMIVGATAIGSLRVYFVQASQYSDDDIELVAAIAEQLALAVRRGQYLRTLRDLSRAIHTRSEARDVLALICDQARRIFGAKGAVIRVVDAESGDLILSGASGLSDAYLQKGPVLPDRSVAEVISGGVVEITDVATDPRVQYPEDAIAEGVASIVGAPLIVGGRTGGALRLYFGERREMRGDEKELLESLAEQAALALRKDLHLQDMQEITAAVRRRVDVKDTLSLICQKATEALFALGATVRILDADTKELKLSASCGLSKSYLDKGTVLSDKSLDEISQDKPVVISDVMTDPRIQHPEAAQQEGIRGIIGVPIRVGENAIGAVRVYLPQFWHPDAGDLDYLTALAEQGGLAIEKNLLYAESETGYRALMDKLKGLAEGK